MTTSKILATLLLVEFGMFLALRGYRVNTIRTYRDALHALPFEVVTLATRAQLERSYVSERSAGVYVRAVRLFRQWIREDHPEIPIRSSGL